MSLFVLGYRWDTRTGSSPTHQVQAHKAEINSVAFHPHQEWMIATGSSDKVSERWNETKGTFSYMHDIILIDDWSI